MNKTITIPDYLTIDHYQKLQYINDIESSHDRILYTLSSIIDISMEELETYPISAITQINQEVSGLLSDINPEFYPVIKWQGKLYGYKSIQKMSMAEYIDLSELVKNPTQNLTNILAILYRPITKNNINSVKYITKSTLKALKYEVENVFDYYEIEEYNADTRKQQADEYKQFPAEIGLGALNFFMLVGLNLLKDTQSYSPNMKEMLQKMTNKKMSRARLALLNTMVGYTSYIKWQTPPSYS